LWKWEKQDKIVPIILPRDFVYMMNNFLSSSGMPQLSDEILKDVGFQIQLGKGEKIIAFKAKIIGFTNEVSSILVPENFMLFGSDVFGDKSKKSYTQLMIKSKKGKFGLVEELIKRNHLEVKKNQIIEGKLKSMLTILLSSISFISLIVVFVSLVVLIQYLQLMITKNAYEIRTMLRLGVKVKTIVFQYALYVFISFVIVMIFISLIDIVSFQYINQILKSSGFVFENQQYFSVVITLISLFSFVFITSIFSVIKFVKKEF
jgi:ABC-type antimicrobial peptide transport system permease subunit